MVADLFRVIESSRGPGPAIEVDVVVQPAARASAVVGVRDGAVRMRVAAPAVEGKVNAAVATLVARIFGVRKSAVTLVRGHHSRNKRIRIEGVTAEAAVRALEEAGALPSRDA